MPRSYVVTGGGRGVGRAVAERLLSDGGAVVIIEFDPEATAWTRGHPAASRIGIRVNAVALGSISTDSISTERHQELLARQDPSKFHQWRDPSRRRRARPSARTRKKPDGQTAPPEDLRRSQGG